MSFRSSALRFFTQSARLHREMHPARIRRLDGGEPIGRTFDVTLSPLRRTQELGENGVVIVYLAKLRVLKSLWEIAEGDEFVDVATEYQFRCRDAVGADDPTSPEIVCEVVRISP